METAECEDELTGAEISCLRLKGQMISLPETENILFLCSPRYCAQFLLKCVRNQAVLHDAKNTTDRGAKNSDICRNNFRFLSLVAVKQCCEMFACCQQIHFLQKLMVIVINNSDVLTDRILSHFVDSC